MFSLNCNFILFLLVEKIKFIMESLIEMKMSGNEVCRKIV